MLEVVSGLALPSDDEVVKGIHTCPACRRNEAFRSTAGPLSIYSNFRPGEFETRLPLRCEHNHTWLFLKQLSQVGVKGPVLQ